MAAIRIITLFVVLTALGVAPARGEFQCVGGPADGTLCGNEGTCGGALCVDISPPTPCDTCPALLVGSASGAPGDDVTITVTFRPGSVDVAGVQNDLRFDPSTPIVKCKVNPDINKGVTAFSFRRSAMRALVSGLDPDPIPEGPLYTCAAQIAEDTAPGTYPLRISNVRGATFNGLPVQTTGQDGAIVVRPPAAGATPLATRTPTPTSTPAPTIDSNGVATFAVNSAVGIAGDRVRLSVTYASTSYGAVGLQNDLVFAVPTLIAGNVGILPDCSMSTDLAASDSRFIFIPFHCVPGVDCWGIRAHIVRPANLDPAGSLLYTCSIQVAADAPPGRYPLRVENAVAGTDHAFQFATRGIDGEIAVIAPANSTPVSTWTPTATPTATPTVPPPITIEVGRATGMLGDDVTVDIVLRANGAVVSEVFSSINFTADTQIIDCTANADIGKIGGFSFQHADDPTSDSISDCMPGIDCNQVVARITSPEVASSIPDNAVLYMCTVRIAATAASGSYALIASGLGAADLASQYIPAVAIDGSIEVVGGPTRTPTPESGAIDSAGPPARQPGADGSGLSASASSDGCATVPAQRRRAAAPLMLLAGLALVFASRRRERRP